jgi:hypothetical protein
VAEIYAVVKTRLAVGMQRVEKSYKCPVMTSENGCEQVLRPPYIMPRIYEAPKAVNRMKLQSTSTESSAYSVGVINIEML